MPAGERDFLTGVIEGFYGPPWTQAERFELFEWMQAWALNAYLYAPKDDLKHRMLWRELYSPAEADGLARLIKECRRRNVRFVYALSPGLNIRYGSATDTAKLKGRLEQLIEAGCQDFALLFDDIPDRLDREDVRRWGSLAAAQAYVSNEIYQWTRRRAPGGRFLFCPTAYCSRMARCKHGGEDYLATIGRELLAEIDVFWTGPEIISREITAAHIEELQTILRRKPVIWDNLHANDYDGRRFFCGPYAGRQPALREKVGGLLSNPNCEFALNYVPLRTLAQFARCGETWKPRAAYLAAMQEWLPRLETVGNPITLDDLVLFGDCYYLPHEEGPEGEALYESTRRLLAGNPKPGDAAEFRSRSGRLREVCARLAELRHRPLFYALSRRIWELREELELLEQHIGNAKARTGDPSLTFHLPGTYRGGMVAKLQRLLIQNSDGTFTPARSCEAAEAPPPAASHHE